MRTVLSFIVLALLGCADPVFPPQGCDLPKEVLLDRRGRPDHISIDVPHDTLPLRPFELWVYHDSTYQFSYDASGCRYSGGRVRIPGD